MVCEITTQLELGQILPSFGFVDQRHSLCLVRAICEFTPGFLVPSMDRIKEHNIWEVIWELLLNYCFMKYLGSGAKHSGGWFCIRSGLGALCKASFSSPSWMLLPGLLSAVWAQGHIRRDNLTVTSYGLWYLELEWALSHESAAQSRHRVVNVQFACCLDCADEGVEVKVKDWPRFSVDSVYWAIELYQGDYNINFFLLCTHGKMTA